MARLLISYDLRKPDFDYQPLYDELGLMGAKHIQDSVWAVSTEEDPGDVYGRLWPCMHGERDRLLVANIGAFKAINSIDKLSSV